MSGVFCSIIYDNTTMKYVLGLLALSGGNLFMSAQDASFSFDHEVKVEMRLSMDKLPKGTFDYAFLYPQEGEVIGIIGDLTHSGMKVRTQAIFDTKNQIIITLLDQGGMKMGMKMNIGQDLPGEAGEKLGKMKIFKTGNTKKILGYDCVEYEIAGPESNGLIWITSKVSLSSFYDVLSVMNLQKQEPDLEIPEGFMMQMTAWPAGKESDEKMELVVTEINMDKSQEMSTAGYQIIDMPNR